MTKLPTYLADLGVLNMVEGAIIGFVIGLMVVLYLVACYRYGYSAEERKRKRLHNQEAKGVSDDSNS